MTTIIEAITIHSEDGDRDHNNTLDAKLDGSQENCPVTFYVDGKAVFSMGNDEIPVFCKAIQSLYLSQ
jgi:hypothetical protein